MTHSSPCPMQYAISRTNAPLSITLCLVLAAGSRVLPAQRPEGIAHRIVLSGGDSTIRRLQQRADSLSRLFSEDEELNLEARRRVGQALDRTVDELTRKSMQMLSPPQFMQIRVGPMASAEATADLSRMLRRSPARDALAPRGWLGIVVTGAAREPWVENGELIIRYLTHPEIVSVEPSSPAERAGLLPSDTLIAYDGRDVRESNISITRLLKPSAHVIVRVRRDGRTRDVPVTIADVPSRIQLRPEYVAEMNIPSMGNDIAAGPWFGRRGTPPIPSLPLPSRQLAARAGRRTPQAPADPSRAPSVPPAATVPYGPGIDGVAGAQLFAMSKGLGKAMGIRSGILVLRAPFGSPAAQSGLRSGDVIVKAGDSELETVERLRDAVRMAVDRGERSLALRILRDRRQRALQLSWRSDDADALP